MYETIRVGDWVIKADVEETRKQYEKEIDMCECLLCQNYREVMKTLPPDKVRIFEEVFSRQFVRILMNLALRVTVIFMWPAILLSDV